MCAALLVLGIAAHAASPGGEDRHPVSGRVIAPVMSYEGAAWLERPERELEEQPSKAIKALGIRPGQVVADVGGDRATTRCAWRSRLAPTAVCTPPTSSRR